MLLIVSAAASLYSQQIPDGDLHTLISAGIDFTLRHRYQSADSVFKVASKQFPDHPAGYLYQAAVLQTQSFDYVVPLAQESFDSLLELGEEKAENLLQENNGSAWGYYFLAVTYGYDSFARVKRGDWLGGLRKGLSAASEFEECVERDSLFYDALAGLGTYYYWRSRKTEFLHWLPFVSDDREEGIKLLVECSTRGVYNRLVALSSLVAIYNDAGQPQLAAAAANQALVHYPLNRVFLWGLGEALLNLDLKKEALGVYDRLLSSLQADFVTNPYSEVVCRLNIVRIKLELHDTTDVYSHLRAVMVYELHEFPDNVKTRAMAKLEEARKIQNSLRNQRDAGN